MFLLVLILNSCTLKNEAKAYFFNTQTGNDDNLGTSEEKPWRSISKLNTIKLNPGDHVYLAQGQTFTGDIALKDIKGNLTAPIKILSYQSKLTNKNTPPQIIGGIEIENSSFIEIYDLVVTKGMLDSMLIGENRKYMRCGILVKTSKPGTYEHIKLKNLYVSDIFFEKKGFKRPKEEVRTPNGVQNYGWGIRFINNLDSAYFRNISIDSSVITNISHTGIKLTVRTNDVHFGLTDFRISNSKVNNTGGPGIQMSGVSNGHVYKNTVDRSGSNDDPRKWGRGSGLWTWGSSNVLIEKNKFINANGPGDSAGAHIDFNCSNIILQYNFSANNAGGFCEILGNNYNCAYRYNISVNDGYRVKGSNEAFQEGKILWLSGYNGSKVKRKGPFNSYIYNNTIYVSKTIDAKIAIDRAARGILIANNIFHIEGASISVKGDQYNPEKEGVWKATNVIFTNNLFLHNKSWPEDQCLQDANPLFGNVRFHQKGGNQMKDYIPENVELIKNYGIVIPKLPQDSIGLVVKLNPLKDILGNPIKGLPDLGAIEID
ncbi:right-handed parallel beta-helix repeat-containing protein [Snuella sedimenti]|uniref:Right-handed parallel beta-helix repeat-containing protein n=1 Tax=Snuella sedimenti TaxID=2798802 RepID=A0A8J7IQ32_9FLAO|nr:right-handed parallel beta-helix repeat-containing protein [Snuella sedimenti]MBJ6368967.1 right-handed parallel beta-helix repeat-containing protein [Snuella sedimenti]